MSESNTHYVGRTIVLRIAASGGRAAARLFRRPDAVARRHGWQITVRSGGWARTYRDPFFDRFSRCDRCVGTGMDTRTLCGACRGTGRLVCAEVARAAS